MLDELALEHVELRQAARRFAQEQLDPIALEIDRTGEVPPSTMDVLREHGYLGMRLPPEIGGAGLSIFEYCIVQEEFSRSHRMFTLLTGATSGLTPTAILRHGSTTQRDKYLLGLATGHLQCAFGLTEPESGSDPAAMRTRAR